MPSFDDLRRRFRDLHAPGVAGFVLPNPFDVGSARILEAMGFLAIATTSSGFAASLGRMDMAVSLDELVGHVAGVAFAVQIPLNVDAERCFAATPDGVAATVDRLAEAGASGISIEDWDPVAGGIDPLDVAVARVAAAAEACATHGIVLTARAENYLHGINDLDDTISRLRAYERVGAGCLYAPGPASVVDVQRIVASVGVPVNVLLRPGAPTAVDVIAAGARRVSTGGALAWAAYGAFAAAAEEVRGPGTTTFSERALPPDLRASAFRA